VNAYNIPRNINTKVRKPMDQMQRLKSYFRKVDHKIYSEPKHKITEPLFLFKLHSHLSILNDHLEIYRNLTNSAMEFIDEKVKENNENWKEINDNLYIRKFKAFQMLLSYLREVARPTMKTIEKYIKFGIYGDRKNKYTEQIKKIV
jgi:hypothetical protein